MAATPKLPRLVFPGWDDVTNVVNKWVEAVEWCLRPQAVAPLKVERGATGPVFKLDAPTSIGIGVTTSAVASGTYGTPGSGTFSTYGMVAGSSAPILTSQMILNVTEKQIASGAGVVYGFDNKNYWVLVVDKCANLS